MALALLELLTGAAALWLGGAWAGRPVHRFLVRLGWRAPGARGPFLGVSVEALALCVLASSRGQTALAAGTAFGGVHVTIALAFGVGLLLSRGPLESPPAAATILPAVPLLATGLAARDLLVTPFEGLALVVAFALFGVLALTVMAPDDARRAARDRTGHVERGGVGSGILGAVAAVAGALFLLKGADAVIVRTNLDAGFVGASLLGLAVALPHGLAFVPSRRRPVSAARAEPFEAAAGLGAAVLGVAAMVHPLVLDGAASSALLAAGVLYAVPATSFLGTGRAGRVSGLLVVGLFGAWLAVTSMT